MLVMMLLMLVMILTEVLINGCGEDSDDDDKNSHILPTGQWYAPSAVNNDAWYCMEFHGIGLF